MASFRRIDPLGARPFSRADAQNPKWQATSTSDMMSSCADAATKGIDLTAAQALAALGDAR